MGAQPVSAKELASTPAAKSTRTRFRARLGLPTSPRRWHGRQLEETEDSLSRLLVSNAKSATKDATSALKDGKAKIAKATPAGSEAAMTIAARCQRTWMA